MLEANRVSILYCSIYLYQAAIKSKNDQRLAETSAGGGDLEGGAQIVNAIFSKWGSTNAAPPEKSLATEQPFEPQSGT
jgi:hypothetical protein